MNHYISPQSKNVMSS